MPRDLNRVQRYSAEELEEYLDLFSLDGVRRDDSAGRRGGGESSGGSLETSRH